MTCVVPWTARVWRRPHITSPRHHTSSPVITVTSCGTPHGPSTAIVILNIMFLVGRVLFCRAPPPFLIVSMFIITGACIVASERSGFNRILGLTGAWSSCPRRNRWERGGTCKGLPPYPRSLRRARKPQASELTQCGCYCDAWCSN